MKSSVALKGKASSAERSALPNIRKQANGYFCTWQGKSKYLARTLPKAKLRLRSIICEENPSRLSVWVDKYLKSISREQSADTVKEKRFQYMELRAFLGDLPASELTTATLNTYFDFKAETVSKNTLKSKVQRVSALLRFIGIEVKLPKIKAPSVGETKLPKKGAIEACYELANARDRMIIDLGRYAGLRRKEIAFI